MDDKNDKTKRLSVYLPEKVKSDLEQMAEETGLSMTQLIVMATHGLLANTPHRVAQFSLIYWQPDNEFSTM